MEEKMSTEIITVSDIHSHILPRFDDGSKSSVESVAMLSSLYDQGVKKVVATPHFYANKDEPREFIETRDATAKHLADKIESILEEEGRDACAMPSVYLGAEVMFFNAMSMCSELEKMCISGTKYLLVEMPFDKWTSAMVQELRLIVAKYGITPIIAHVERYFQYFRQEMLDEMIKEGMLIQSNAEAFLGIWTRKRALKLLEDGKIHLLGSDAHDMERRAPKIKEALAAIEKKLGTAPIEKLCENSEKILSTATPIWTPGR